MGADEEEQNRRAAAGGLTRFEVGRHALRLRGFPEEGCSLPCREGGIPRSSRTCPAIPVLSFPSRAGVALQQLGIYGWGSPRSRPISVGKADTSWSNAALSAVGPLLQRSLAPRSAGSRGLSREGSRRPLKGPTDWICGQPPNAEEVRAWCVRRCGGSSRRWGAC
jgi:hypothetical protein